MAKQGSHAHTRRSSWKLRLITVTCLWLVMAGVLLALQLISRQSADRELALQNELTQNGLTSLLLSDQILKGSDRLTAAITGFAATRSLSYSQTFFQEMEVNKTQEHALNALFDVGFTQEELAPILRAKKLSDALLQDELYALRLLFEANGQALPQQLTQVTIPPHVAALSPEEKRATANDFIFGTQYRALKDEIRDNVALFNTRRTQQVRTQFEYTLAQSKAMMGRQMFVNVFTLLWPLVLLLLLYRLLVRPVSNYSRFLNQQNDGHYTPLELHGSHELQTLGLAFNNVLLELQEAKERLVLQNQELTVLSSTDYLTKLLNRLAMENYMNNLLETWDSTIPLSVVMLDLDHFKDFNDTYGHPAGDEALRSVASLISVAAEGRGGLASRMGGEEFFLLLPGMGSEELDAFCEEILQAVRQLPIAVSPEASVHLSVSLGSYTALNVITPPKVLYSRADKALYHAKQSGRDRYVNYATLPKEAQT